MLKLSMVVLGLTAIILASGFATADSRPPAAFVNVTPNYYETYSAGDWVKYSDVYPSAINDLKCKFMAYSETSQSVTIKYQYFVSANPTYDSVLWNSSEYTLTCPAGQWCEVEIPYDSLMMPGRYVGCTSHVLGDPLDSCLSGSWVKLPQFDLKISKISLTNVVEETTLVRDRPLVVRAWPTFTSDLIDEFDREVKIKTGYYYGTSPLYNEKTKSGKVEIYPSLGDMKADWRGAREGDGKTYLKFLREIKFAEDSINFFDVKTPHAIGNYVYQAEINPDGEIFESSAASNIRSTEFKVTKQKKENYKFGVIILTTLPANKASIQQAVITSKQSYDFIREVYPFEPQGTTLDKPKVIQIEVDKNRLKNLKDYEYRRKLRKSLIKKMEKYDEKYDFLFVVVADNDKEIMRLDGGGFADAVTIPDLTKKIILMNGAIKDIAAPAHEMGHLLGHGDEHYNSDIGIDAFSAASPGWSFNLDTMKSKGPKIVVWDIPNSDGGFNNVGDCGWHFPLGSPLFSTKSCIGVVEFYGEIMGSFKSPNVWTTNGFYRQYGLDKLTEPVSP